MPRDLKVLSISVMSLLTCMMSLGAVAAVGRDGYSSVRATSIGEAGTARMPTMPTLSIMTVGTMTQDIPTKVSGMTVPDVPDIPDVPDSPDVPDNPTVTPDCPDGGVRDSQYTIDMCMNDVFQCVNFGALPNGLNDMFDVNTRNSIVNGMGLCVPQVDKCIAQVRRDCGNIYRSASDVWVDFNSRRVQPEYYNFVLRKTGLTPNQAENTCKKLDGDARNGQNARWDAKTASCNVRVAAYNKDNHITNTWLFGTLGDDRPAEVWLKTGDTFTCNKDLFGFSLLKDTSTAAVVGVGGGTLVGAGVGAIAGHGARDFDCARIEHREKLAQELRQMGQTRILNQFLEPEFHLPLSGELKIAQCNAVLDLYDKYQEIKAAIDECNGYTITEKDVTIDITLEETVQNQLEVSVRNGKPVLDDDKIAEYRQQLECTADGCPKDKLVEEITQGFQNKMNKQTSGKCRFKQINLAKMRGESIFCEGQSGCIYHDQMEIDVQPLADVLDSLQVLKGEESNMGKSIGIGAATGAGVGGLATAITASVEKNNVNCRVADNLEQVGLGKSHVIGSLRDYYVKWDLKLPDVIAPTATIDGCDSWKYNCSRYMDMDDCENAQFNYKPVGASTFTLVHSVCRASGGVCIENYPVAKSHGACE